MPESKTILAHTLCIGGPVIRLIFIACLQLLLQICCSDVFREACFFDLGPGALPPDVKFSTCAHLMAALAIK